jgi:hypothetical protein
MTMDPRHDPERAMQSILCGDLPRDDQAFERGLAADPALRARWEALSALVATLDSTGRRERAIRAQSQSAFPGQEERVAELVRRHLRRRQGSTLPRWLWGALLAAGLAAILWTIRAPGEPRLPDLEQVVLGPGSAALGSMRATEVAERTYRLEWADAEQAFGRTYVVRIHDRGGAEIGAVIEALGSGELSTPTWTLSLPAGRDPERLAWSIEARDADGNVAAVSAVQALSAP